MPSATLLISYAGQLHSFNQQQGGRAICKGAFAPTSRGSRSPHGANHLKTQALSVTKPKQIQSIKKLTKARKVQSEKHAYALFALNDVFFAVMMSLDFKKFKKLKERAASLAWGGIM
jgi:hypothetical protein